MNSDHTAVLDWNSVKQNILGLFMLYVNGSLKNLESADFERQILAAVLRDVQNNWSQINEHATRHVSGVPIFEMTCHNDTCRTRLSSSSDTTAN